MAKASLSSNSPMSEIDRPVLASAFSGVRLMTQLSRQFAQRPDVRYGLTAMCIGIGMGGTVIWENPNWEGAAK